MLKNSIKKITLILFSILSISFIGINNVKADDWKTLCRYEGEADDYYYKIYIRHNEKNDTYRFSIYEYDDKKDLKSNDINDQLTVPKDDDDWKTGKKLEDLVSSKGKDLNYYNHRIAMSKTTIDSLEDGRCPSYAWPFAPWGSMWRMCFDDDDGFCPQIDNSSATSEFKYKIDIAYAKKGYTPISDSGTTQLDVKDKAKEDCEGILGKKSDPKSLINYLQKIFNIIKIAAPILVLGLTIFEFVKATVSQDQEALKKASNIFIKRLIMMAILFFLPTLIQILLIIINNNSGTCQIT